MIEQNKPRSIDGPDATPSDELKDPKPSEEGFEQRLEATFDELRKTFGQPFGLIGTEKALLAAHQQAITAAEERGVAWAIKVLDEMHMRIAFDASDDATFKGIKNTLRDRFKSITGIDPAPSYPIEAELTARKEGK